jgi:K+-sensing histidine kinase KdpD
MSVLYRDFAVKAAVPLIFLIVLIPVAQLSGRMASLAVATIAGFIFAACLFKPYGSLAIRSTADRIELLVFGVAALGVIHFSPCGRSVKVERTNLGDGRQQSVSVRSRAKRNAHLAA